MRNTKKQLKTDSRIAIASWTKLEDLTGTFYQKNGKEMAIDSVLVFHTLRGWVCIPCIKRVASVLEALADCLNSKPNNRYYGLASYMRI